MSRPLPVLLPRRAPERLRLGSLALPVGALVALLASSAWAQAVAAPGRPGVFAALLRWLPVILPGFALDIGIGVLAMALGTVLGGPLGLLLLARSRALRGAGWAVVQFFRNTPWLVLLFYVMFLTPFALHLGPLTVPLPDWGKCVVGLALPVAANVAEIVRGGVQSIPPAQWEAAESLGFGRLQILGSVILPQALRRMLPPWVNLHAVLIMATTLISIVGLQDGLTLTKAAIAAEGRPELLMPMYLLLLLLFFAYCYPVARLSLVLERRVAVAA